MKTHRLFIATMLCLISACSSSNKGNDSGVTDSSKDTSQTNDGSLADSASDGNSQHDSAGQDGSAETSEDATAKPSQYVFVSNADSHNVTIIDALSPKATSIDCSTLVNVTCSEPRNLAVNHAGTLVAVPFRHSDNVLMLNIASQSFTDVISDVSFDEPYAVAFSSDDTEVWVANKKGGGSTVGSISIINVASKKVIATVEDAAFSSPEGILISGNNAYVANRGNGTMTMVNVSTRKVGKTITIGGSPRFAVATPNGNYVYVSTDASELAKVRTSDGVVEKMIAVSSSRNLAMNPDGKTVYVAHMSSSIATVDVATNAIGEIPLTNSSNVYGVAIMSDGSLGFATSEGSNAVHVFDVKQKSEITGGGFYPVTVGSTPRAIAAQ